VWRSSCDTLQTTGRPGEPWAEQEILLMTARRHVSRRAALKLGAAATALPLVHILTAGAAGKFSLALWDHWVPTGDPAMKQLIDAWAEKNKVAVSVDFIPSVGSKISITMAAEAQTHRRWRHVDLRHEDLELGRTAEGYGLQLPGTPAA
jgi:hypothetical protein